MFKKTTNFTYFRFYFTENYLFKDMIMAMIIQKIIVININTL